MSTGGQIHKQQLLNNHPKVVIVAGASRWDFQKTDCPLVHLYSLSERILWLQQGVLATYLLPGCGGKGGKFLSESSTRGVSVVGSSVFKAWRTSEVRAQRSWRVNSTLGKQEHIKMHFKSKSVLPKILARSWLVGKKTTASIIRGRFWHFIHGPEKKTCGMFCLFSLVVRRGPIYPVWPWTELKGRQLALAACPGSSRKAGAGNLESIK